MFKTLKPVMRFASIILAIVTLVVIVAFILNGAFHFLPKDGIVIEIFQYIKMYGTLLTCGLVALEAASDRGIILLAVLLCIIIIVIATFFPSVRDQILGKF